MRRSHHAVAAAAIFGLAVLASGTASASPMPSDALKSVQAQAYPGEAYSQYRYRGYHGGYRGGRGVGAAAAGIGLAAGLLGAAIVASQPATAAPVYGGGGPRWNRYCFRKFGPAFDPASGTYLGADGYRYPCQ